MLNVFFTVDVEVWCGGWQDLDERFPAAYQRYIHGKCATGNFGLPYQLDVMADHGIDAVFFVEPLFSTRFGADPLQETVGLILERNQEVQLHLHTEWVDEARQPLFPDIGNKRQNMRDFSLDDQKTLLQKGVELLLGAGADHIDAFRAGNFGMNVETLTALAAVGIEFDSSYNALMYGPESGLLPGVVVNEPLRAEGVNEYPMTVYHDYPNHLRHTQVAAASSREMEELLWRALQEDRRGFVILFHSFELIDTDKDRVDRLTLRRFRKLCQFLDRNRDSFRVRGFCGLAPEAVDTQPPPMTSPLRMTAARMFEQGVLRKLL